MPGLGKGNLGGHDFGRALLSPGALGSGDSSGGDVPVNNNIQDENNLFVLDENSFTIQQNP